MTVRNGLTLAYVVAFVNATLAMLASFGLNLTQDQQVSVVTFVNVALLLSARVLHMPEKTLDGGTVTVTHVPVLTTTPPDPNAIPDPSAPVVVE